ncbi:MAG: SpoIID/LytB domain-containing protein [Clostridiaceae bacterium]|nr:SpoIID/LytB domain-containing protein [Clostridiaceae bacterium]
MKKHIICLAFFLLSIVNVYADLPDKIRVGLYYGTNAPQSVTVHTDNKDTTIINADIPKEGILFAGEDEDIIKVNGKPYKGEIFITKDEAGNMTVINEVEIDEYVSSVIAKEMSSSFEPEALKAQAVYARTYAVVNVGKHPLFDVCATNHCQVYCGAASGDEKTDVAAKQTTGEILTYQGKPAQTVYFATSGGHTESAKFIWGTDTPYLTAVSDKYESQNCYLYNWEKEISPGQITDIMSAKGYDVGNVRQIDVLEQTDNGVVYKLRIVGDTGEKTITNEWCRILFGGLLPSQAYSVSHNSGVLLTTYSGPAYSGKVSILSADGQNKHNEEQLYIMGGDSSSIIQTPKPSDSFVFSGRGNGHLVGMSQNGANGMALAGFTYEQILLHYYSGTEISKIGH